MTSSHSASPLRPTAMHAGASKTWIGNPSQTAGPTASSPKGHGSTPAGSPEHGSGTSTAWPMPPGPSAKPGQTARPPSDRKPAAASDGTASAPPTAPAGPTTSRYPGRSTGPSNSTAVPQGAGPSRPAAAQVDRPNPAPNVRPTSPPPHPAPTAQNYPVEPSKGLPNKPPTNGDGHHD